MKNGNNNFLKNSVQGINYQSNNVGIKQKNVNVKRGSTSDSTKHKIMPNQNYLANSINNSNNENSGIRGLITQSDDKKPYTGTNKSLMNSPRVLNDKIAYSLSPKRSGLKRVKDFLPEKSREKMNKKTLVLDLDETLVHSSFIPFERPDIILKIDLENRIHQIYVLKRPGVEEFLEKMSRIYEVVIFTASLSKYADPLIDKLDPKRHCNFRLFREHCTYIQGSYIKDLSSLGRNLKDVIIIDNTPNSFSFQVENGIPIKSWYEDKRDKDLWNLIPILEFLSQTNDVRDYLKKFCINNEISYQIAYNILSNIKQEEKYENQSLNRSLKDNENVNNVVSIKNQSKISNLYQINPQQPISPTFSKFPNNINILYINNNINNYIVDPNKDKKTIKEEKKNVNTFRKDYANELYSSNTNSPTNLVYSPDNQRYQLKVINYEPIKGPITTYKNNNITQNNPQVNSPQGRPASAFNSKAKISSNNFNPQIYSNDNYFERKQSTNSITNSKQNEQIVGGGIPIDDNTYKSYLQNSFNSNDNYIKKLREGYNTTRPSSSIDKLKLKNFQSNNSHLNDQNKYIGNKITPQLISNNTKIIANQGVEIQSKLDNTKSIVSKNNFDKEPSRVSYSSQPKESKFQDSKFNNNIYAKETDKKNENLYLNNENKLKSEILENQRYKSTRTNNFNVGKNEMKFNDNNYQNPSITYYQPKYTNNKMIRSLNSNDSDYSNKIIGENYKGKYLI